MSSLANREGDLMKRTVIFEFPEGFEFPEVGDSLSSSGACSKCPCSVYSDYFYHCILTDDILTPCPFFDSRETYVQGGEVDVWGSLIMNTTDFNEFYSKTVGEPPFHFIEFFFIKMMSEMLNAAINDQTSDASIEKIKAISKTALEGAWKDKLNSMQTSHMTKADFFALADAACDKPRSQAFEEWLNASDDEVSSTRYYYSDSFPERAEKSKLYELGYSVSQESGLSDQFRRDLLESIIRSGQMTKAQVANHLYYLIKINGKKGTNDIAVAKWKRDLEFVKTL